MPALDGLGQFLDLIGIHRRFGVFRILVLLLVFLHQRNQVMHRLQRGALKCLAGKTFAAGAILGGFTNQDLRQIQEQGMLSQPRFTVNQHGVRETPLRQGLRKPFPGLVLAEGACKSECHAVKVTKG